MNKSEIIVIGGSAAGLVAASTAKNNYPNKQVTLFRKEAKVMIPCGIPYIYGTLDSSNENILPDQGLIDLGVNIKVETIKDINHEGHTITTASGEVYQYEKLILATGSEPVKPDFIPGSDLENVFVVPKNKDYLDGIKACLSTKKNVVVIGAGFIGVEMSDELNKAGHKVTLIESRDNILGATFSPDACEIAEEILTKHGLTIKTKTRVNQILGDKQVSEVVLDDGSHVKADAVIISIGYKANVSLAEKSGISVNKQGAIKVDQFLRTHQKDVYACGDCAQKRDFITGRITNIMLASTACAEARIASMNLYNISTIRTFNGTIGIYSTSIGDTSFGVAGITEMTAKQEGFAVSTATFKGMDRHPGKLNNPHSQSIKLICNENTGLILGAEAIGGVSVGELTNVLGFIIQNKMTVSDVLCSQIGTQPMLTASPAKYPLIKAAEMIAKKLNA